MKKIISLILALILIAACLSVVSFAADAEVSYTVGTTTKEGTLKEAVKAVSPKGGTIKLLKDVTHKDKSPAISSSSSFTLDLNGHTLTSANGGVSVTEKATGVTVIKNGKIVANNIGINISGGGLTMRNVECWSEKQQTVSFNDATGKYNAQNLIENCKLANPIWGAISFNNTKQSMEKTSLTVRNSILVDSKAAGGNVVVMQKKAVSATLIVGEGTKFMSFKKSGSVFDGTVKVTGISLAKAPDPETVKIAGKEIKDISVWMDAEQVKELEKKALVPADPSVIPATPKNAASEAGWAVKGVVSEGTLKDAVAAVSKSGGAIKLYKDINNKDEKVGYVITSSSSFTLDLNGHSIKSVTRAVSVTGSGKTGTTLITSTNGKGYVETTKLSFDIKGGGLQMKNIENWCETQQNLAFYDTTGKYNAYNRIEDSVLANPRWGALAFNATKSQATVSMNIKNSTLAGVKETGDFAVVLQTKATNGNLVLEEGVKFMSYKTGAANFVDSKIICFGEPVTLAAEKTTLTIGERTFKDINVWTTPEKATFVPKTNAADGKEVEYTVDGVTKVGTLKEAVKAVSPKGGTIKLLADYYNYDLTVSNLIVSASSFTLDLNGHTMYSVTRGISVSGTGKVGTTVITDTKGGGVMDCLRMNANITAGGLHVNNVTLWSDKQQNVSIEDTTGKWNDKNIIENSTLANSAFYALSFNNTKESMEKTSVTIRNSTLANVKSSSAIGVQPKAVSGSVVLGEGVKLMTVGKDPVAKTINVIGITLGKCGVTETISVAGREFTGLDVWMEAEEAKAITLAAMLPADSSIIPAEPKNKDSEAGWYVKGKTAEIKEGTLKDAVAAVSKTGGAIKLYKNVANTDEKVPYAISSSSSFTLDLNNHNITSVTGAVRVAGTGKVGTTLITNSGGKGYVESTKLSFEIKAGGLQIKNITGWCETQQNVGFYDTTGRYNAYNRIENTVLANPRWGAIAFNTNNMDKASMNIKNSTLAAVKKTGSGDYVIVGRTGAQNVILEEGVKFMTYKTTYAASATCFFGETLTKSAKRESLSIGDRTFKNLTVWTTPAKATVKAKVDTADEKIIEYTVDGVSKVGTLAEAVKAVSPAGGTIKLLADYCNTDFTNSYLIVSASSFTLDLNGHTLYTVGSGINMNGTGKVGTTVIIDTTGGGVMDCFRMNANVSAGGLHVNNVTMWSDKAQNISFYDTTGEWNDKNIIENSVLANPVWGAISFNNTKESMEKTTLLVRNSTLANVKSSNTVVKQTKAGTPNLILGEGVKLMTMGNDPVGSGVKVTGEELSKVKITFKNRELRTLEVAGRTFEKMQLWKTAEPELPPVLPIISLDCTYTVNGVTKTGPMADAMKAVSAEGGTIKMLKDYTYMDAARTFALVSDSAFTLDLNGHTIKSVGHGISVTGSGKIGTTLITDSVGGGAIIADGICVSVTAGGLHLNGVTMWSSVQQNVAYYDVSGAFNDKNIIENSVLGNPAWGALVFNNTKASMEKASFTVRNSTLVNGFKLGGDAIVAQTRAKGANVVLGEGVVLMSYAAKGDAIHDIVKTTGEAVVESVVTENVEIAGNKLTGLSVWATKAPAKQ